MCKLTKMCVPFSPVICSYKESMSSVANDWHKILLYCNITYDGMQLKQQLTITILTFPMESNVLEMQYKLY